MNLLHNITSNLTNLQNDLTGITIHPSGIGHFLLDVLITIGVFLIYYLLGKKVRTIFFSEVKNFQNFINIALGYIIVGTGIAILGVFSLLQTNILIIYFLIILIVSFYQTDFLAITRINFKLVKSTLKNYFSSFDKLIFIGVLLFVSIAFLRLMLPETGEDGYHTDYPKMYLASHTMILQSKDMLHAIPYSQLAEMTYLIPIFLGEKDATRFIHFGFYILILLLLFKIIKKSEFSFAKYSPLIFVTTPLVIRYSSSAFTDLFLVFTFLLSIVLLAKKSATKNLILSGILFGAALSTKLWILIYFPILLIYLAIINWNIKKSNIVKLLLVFIISALSISGIWYIRDFIITGNPIYPFLANIQILENHSYVKPPPPSSYIGLNTVMLSYPNLIVLSPLFFLGILFCFIFMRKVISTLKHSTLAIFILLLTIEQLTIKAGLGRYLITWHTISSLIVSAGFSFAINKSRIIYYGLISLFLVIFSYYFVNTLLTLPYGLGWADQNKYLTRILERDWASYYDFDHLFDKWITKNDLVAVYGLDNFYYANFRYLDVGYIFDNNHKSFLQLKDKHVTKLIIKGGDIQWFCQQLQLTECDVSKAKLLASYPSIKSKNLYSLQW